MNDSVHRQLLAVALCSMALGAVVAAQRGESVQPKPAARPAPRLADGKPDLAGIWNKRLRTNIAAGIQPLPFTPAGLKAYNEIVTFVDPTALCLFPGIPRVHVEPHPFQIVQQPDKVIVLYEFMHNFRVIPTDGRPQPVDFDPAFMGHSVAKWDGDTLVVDVIGFTDRTWLDPHGNPHSDALHLTERFRRVNYEELTYDVTIDDPKFYTKPWTAPTVTFTLAPGDWELMEYACNDNNKDLRDGLVAPGPLDGSTRDGSAIGPVPRRPQ